VEQLLSKNAQVHRVEQIEWRISKLPPRAHNYWLDQIPLGNPRAMGSESLTPPPPKIRKAIRQFAEKHHLQIEIQSRL
jgi:hypothetical protein